MIKANELRIGNWVQAPLGEWMQVNQIGHHDNPDYIHAEGPEGFGQNGFDPIELTPEVFRKAGFKSRQEARDSESVFNEYGERYLPNPKGGSWDYRRIYGLADHSIYHIGITHVGNGEYSCTNARVHGKTFKYLHQLQNLYFALTGEELSINL